MLKYRVNRRKVNKTKVELTVENISFVDFENLVDEDEQPIGYDGDKVNKIMVTCECSDIDKIKNGSFVTVLNTLFLDYPSTDGLNQERYNFVQDYQVIGANPDNRSFSFYIDKYYTLNPTEIITGENNENAVYLHFDNPHYFDNTDDIIVYFRYTNINGEIVIETVTFEYFTPYVLVSSYDNFQTEDKKKLYSLIFGTQIEEDIAKNVFKFVKRDDEYDKLTQEQYDALEEDEKVFYVLLDNQHEGNLGLVETYRDNFLFGDKTDYEISFERPLGEIKVPIVNTFETTLHQMELLNEHFVNAEKKKAINRITDLEKDVYYPCISNETQTSYKDVYRIKINLHFREHRGEDWLVENESFWNCIEVDEDGKAKIVNENLTDSNISDLLTFLGFTNNDVHYQKNKLKKSFLRLMYFDSTNPANQNMLGYSTVFFNTGDLFAKYIRYIEEEGYTAVNADKNEYGKYKPSEGKIGIRVDRDKDISDYEDNKTDFDDRRLSSQLVVKNKNLSKASSEGFYLYIWKDNEMALPQDLYMKVEFNHAGYGRTVPFMMPYWDSQKWNGKKGIKNINEILDDWNSEAQEQLDEYDRVVWQKDGRKTDGHYGIRQYTKFSYIHLKYRYDKDNDKHIYYLDPDTYGNIDFPKGKDGNEEIEINLYEAKVE